MPHPTRCHGPSADLATHTKGCRPGRPLCRFMRQVRPQRRVCNCAAYFFPHRSGSGACRVGIPAILLRSLKKRDPKAYAECMEFVQENYETPHEMRALSRR